MQDRREINLDAARGIAVREFQLRTGFGFADYMLYVDGSAVGVIEAKKAGVTLTGTSAGRRGPTRTRTAAGARTTTPSSPGATSARSTSSG